MPNPSIIQLLLQIPLLVGITEAEAISLYMASEKLRLKKSEILVEVGQTEPALYIILSGKVNVVLANGDGKTITLATLGAGECIGEMGALDQQPASATVITDSTVDVLRLDSVTFRDVLYQNPHISATILQTLALRLSRTQQQIIRLANMSVQGRVAQTLVEMATRFPSGEYLIRGKVRRGALAAKVGASREMVSKALKELEANGFIVKSPDGSMRIQNKRVRPRD